MTCLTPPPPKNTWVDAPPHLLGPNVISSHVLTFLKYPVLYFSYCKTITHTADSAGVLPLASGIVGSAPWTTSSSTWYAWPALAATWRGVFPLSWKQPIQQLTNLVTAYILLYRDVSFVMYSIWGHYKNSPSNYFYWFFNILGNFWVFTQSSTLFPNLILQSKSVFWYVKTCY